MTVLPCLFSSATALRRVFIQNVRQTTWQTQRVFLPAFPSSLNSPIRTISRGGRRGGNNNAPSSRPTRKFPRDADIKSPFVIVRSADGTLSEPQRTRYVLQNLDSTRESLVVVAYPNLQKQQQGDEGSQFKWPICKVADLQEEQRKEQEEIERQKAARKLAVRTKEMELNWAIAPNDLRTRLRQLKTFLEKGLRVQILLLNKTGRDKKKKATIEEATEVLQLVKGTIEEVKGCKEYKASEGHVGGQYKMFYDGPMPKPKASISGADEAVGTEPESAGKA